MPSGTPLTVRHVPQPQPFSPFRKLLRAIAVPAVSLLVLAVAPQPAAHAQTWNLIWSDEFNGASGTYPDSSKWTYDTGNNNGWGNGEIEYYCAAGSNAAPCSTSRPNAYQDGSGNLILHATKDSSGQWTSARLKTQGIFQFQYGRAEARMKLPVGDGLWPAFWMLGSDITSVGWPQSGEQDIMEWVQSYGPNTTSSTTHGPGYSGGNGIGARYTFPNGGRVDDAGYHVYGVIWSPNQLQYYRDSTSNIFLTLSSSTIPSGSQWVFNNPFFLLLNFAVGSGGFPGPTDSSTPSSANVLVDYVRVYQQGSGGGSAANLNGTHMVVPANATGSALDDNAGGTGNGNKIQIWGANGTGAQKWVFNNSNVQPAGYYNIAVSVGAYCATASGSNSGSTVNLQPCNGSAGQAWQAVASGSGYVLHPATNTSLCLDVQSAGTANGTPVQVWSCNNTNAQNWALR